MPLDAQVPVAEVADAEHALAQVGVDPRAALDEADAVLARIPRRRTPDDVRAVATAHRAAGLSLRSLGDPAAAERRLRRGVTIADRAGQPELAAEVRMSHAFVLLDVGRVSAALKATDRALDALTGVKAARVRTIRALVLHRAGRSDDAFAEYAAALPVLRRAEDHDWEARLRHNRALLELELGRTDEAVADLERVRQHDLESGHVADAADALFNMGVARQRAGDIPAALALFNAAEVEWAGLERPERWIARSEAYLSVGLVDDAVRDARSAVAWLTGRGWDALEGYAHINLAHCLLVLPAPDLDGARAAAGRAHAEFASRKRPEAQAIADYVRLTAALLGDPRTRELALVPEAIASLDAAGYAPESADLRVTAGAAALHRSDGDDARALLGPLASMVRARHLDVRSRAWFGRALLARETGDGREAMRCLRQAWVVVETQRSLLRATELRASSALHTRALITTGTALAVESGSCAEVLGWAERGRTAALRYRPVSAPSDPGLAAALARLRWVASREEESRFDGNPSLGAGVARARAEADVVRITRASPGGASGLSVVTMRDVRDQLDGETLVEYVAAGEELWAVTVGRRRARLIRLGPVATTRDMVQGLTFAHRRLLAGFGTPQGQALAAEAFARGLAALDAALIAPLVGDLGDDDLVVCPNADLAAVPWHALTTTAGRTTRIAPSATLWCTARRGAPTAGVVVAVAGPGLSGADAEVSDVAGLHPGALRITGADATVARVLEATPRAALLHLAAHGRLRTDNPLFSSLELADGPMTAYDLERLPRVPGSVVLSACSSGAGHATTADETLGLAWTLLGLGARSVVAPLLPVPDEATRAVMVALHTRMRSGAPIATALAEARRAVDPDDPLQSAAAAAFVAFGA